MSMKTLKERIDERVAGIREEVVATREADAKATAALVDAKPDVMDPKTHGAKEVRLSRNGNLIITF